jgi:hypothetical protein
MARIRVVEGGEPSRVRVVPTKEMAPDDYVAAIRRYLQNAIERGRYETALKSAGYVPDTPHMQDFLHDPMKAWMSSGDASFLFGALGITESALYMPDRHARFVTKAEQSGLERAVFVFDPMKTGNQKLSVPARMDDLFMVLSPDLERDYLRNIEGHDKSRVTYLLHRGYNRMTDRALGGVQRDSWNCIPHSIHAAARARPGIKLL